MLELSDPLWNKLDDANRDEHIPTLLGELAASWDAETADSLFGALWHQYSCFGATYAAIPYLLKIAEPEENQCQRLHIALFLTQVTLDSCYHRREPGDRSEDGELQGLPETLEEWDQTRDWVRSCVERLEHPDQPCDERDRIQKLPRYREILATEPVNAGDLEKILGIKADFYSALPAIRALCERALFENWNVDRYLLSGIAAADGLIGIARLLEFGPEGEFSCASCDWIYEYLLFEERIAVYADTPRGVPRDDKSLCDFKEGEPSRADGFMMPIAEDDALDARVAALLSLAKRAPSPDPALLVRHFAGSFVCCKCGLQGPMHPPW